MGEPASASAGESGREEAIRRLAVRLFLLSLGILFAAAEVGYLVIRLRAAHWPPPGYPGLPHGVWTATAFLVGLSAILYGQLTAARRGHERAAHRLAMAAPFLAVGFLLVQVHNWSVLAATGVVPGQSLPAWGFWVLGGLHALHAVGGLVPLVAGWIRPSRSTAASTAAYWHFLLAVWISLLVVLGI